VTAQLYLKRALRCRSGTQVKRAGALIGPSATIIDARRDPMSCGFSIFKQLFAEGQEFSYNLEDIGKYYNNYVELMDHWNTVLPGKILKMQQWKHFESDLGPLSALVSTLK
jgi:hypothetical protein